jgi:hypothetical protein
MKAKLVLAFAVLLSTTVARADSTPITLDVTATACVGCLSNNPPPISLIAQFTVEQVTGQFFQPGEGLPLFTGTEYEVVGISGTLNGSRMTLAPTPEGVGSWLSENSNGDFELGTVFFTANGSLDWLESDPSNDLLEISSGYAPSNAITWNAVDPAPAAMPEPSTWLLLLAGIGFVLIRAVKTRKQLAG